VDRKRAFLHALHDRKLDDEAGLVAECGTWSEDEGAAALRQLLDAGVDFTAVVAGNDLIALGCYDVFAERGISCPRDISVVGFNDMPFLDKLRPPLTSVRVPHYEVGAEAARMLLDGLRDPNRHARSMLLPLSLVNRQSTAPPAQRV
jgi:LacI family transcriptional regulator